MNAVTHSFKVASGIEAEISQLTGVEQDILTSQKSQSAEVRNLSMLASILKRVGEFDLTTMSDEERMTFIKSMPSCDKKAVLCEARAFSNDFDPIYDFNYEYQSVDAEKGKQVYPQTITLGGGSFPIRPIKEFDEKMLLDKDNKPLKKLRDIEAVLRRLQPKVFENYKQVLDNKFIYATLPNTNVKIRMRMLDSVGESIGAAVKKEQRSSHTTLLMRNVCYQAENGNTYISFQHSDLNKLPINDLEFMRLLRNYVEGNVDSEIQFEHPEAELKAPHEKIVTLDLLSEISFFFPSGTI